MMTRSPTLTNLEIEKDISSWRTQMRCCLQIKPILTLFHHHSNQYCHCWTTMMIPVSGLKSVELCWWREERGERKSWVVGKLALLAGNVRHPTTHPLPKGYWNLIQINHHLEGKSWVKALPGNAGHIHLMLKLELDKLRCFLSSNWDRNFSTLNHTLVSENLSLVWVPATNWEVLILLEHKISVWVERCWLPPLP